MGILSILLTWSFMLIVFGLSLRHRQPVAILYRRHLGRESEKREHNAQRSAASAPSRLRAPSSGQAIAPAGPFGRGFLRYPRSARARMDRIVAEKARVLG